MARHRAALRQPARAYYQQLYERLHRRAVLILAHSSPLQTHLAPMFLGYHWLKCHADTKCQRVTPTQYWAYTNC